MATSVMAAFEKLFTANCDQATYGTTQINTHPERCTKPAGN